jgi:hypothetical protein
MWVLLSCKGDGWGFKLLGYVKGGPEVDLTDFDLSAHSKFCDDVAILQVWMGSSLPMPGQCFSFTRKAGQGTMRFPGASSMSASAVGTVNIPPSISTLASTVKMRGLLANRATGSS